MKNKHNRLFHVERNNNQQKNEESHEKMIPFETEGNPTKYFKKNSGRRFSKGNYYPINYRVEGKEFKNGECKNYPQNNLIFDIKLNLDVDQKASIMNKQKYNSIDLKSIKNRNDMKRCKKGLKNESNIDYLNSTIQCFIRLSNVYKNLMGNKITIEKYSEICPLSFSILRATIHLFDTKDTSSYNLSILHKLLVFLNPMFKDDSKIDPINVIIFILDNLNSELKLPKINYPSFDAEIIKGELIKYLNDIYLKNNKSFISQLFCWIKQNEKICSECNNKTYFFNYFYTLDLDYKNVYNSFIFEQRNEKIITINDCLDFQSKKKILFNNYCNKCKRKVLMTYSCSSIINYPLIFIFVVKDLVNEIEDITIKFEEDLVINQRKYKLKSIVAYEKNDGKNGNYISYCQDFVDKNWYSFKDEEVNQTQLKDIIKINQKKVVPLILFYKYYN